MKTVTLVFSPKDFNFLPLFHSPSSSIWLFNEGESAALTDAQGRKLGDVTTRSGFGGKEGKGGKGDVVIIPEKRRSRRRRRRRVKEERNMEL